MNCCFYSHRDSMSKSLVILMKNENLIPLFKMLSIEEHEKFFPPQIKHIPTLIIAGIQKLFVGEEAFKWIQRLKYIRAPPVKNDSIENDSGNNSESNYKDKEKDKFKDCVISEISGFSDNYAFTDPNINNAQPKSFFGYKEEEKNTILTCEELPKVNTNETKKIIANATKERTEFDSNLKRQMLIEQENLVKKYIKK